MKPNIDHESWIRCLYEQKSIRPKTLDTQYDKHYNDPWVYLVLNIKPYSWLICETSAHVFYQSRSVEHYPPHYIALQSPFTVPSQ